MNENQIDLSKIEKQTYLAFHQDGLLDLFAGLIIIILGGLMYGGMMQFAGLPGIILLLYLPMKQKVTFPRISYINYAPSQKARLTILSIVSIIVGLAVLGTNITNYFSFGSVLIEYMILLTGIALGGIIAAGAYLVKVKRYYIYALIVALGFALANFSVGYLPHLLLLIGLIMASVGIILLIAFLKNNPRQILEESL